MKRLLAAGAALLIGLATTGTARAEEWTSFGLNTGDEGLLLLELSEGTSSEDHKMTSLCTFKHSRSAAGFAVSGKTHATAHPTPAAVSIRCIVMNSVGVVLFDQSRSAGGPVVTLEGTGTGGSNRDLTICTEGTGHWNDGHVRQIGRQCEYPGRHAQPVDDLVAALVELTVDTVDSLVVQLVDPVACQVIRELRPGVPGVVDVNDQGDVFVLGEPFWDCPPYDLGTSWSVAEPA